MSHGHPPRSAPPIFRPRFTVMVLYLFAFLGLYLFVLAAPELIPLVQPMSPEQEEAAKEAAAAGAYKAVRPKVLFAFVASVLTVAAGAYTRKLPGLGS